ncbi:unnamed protein product [Gadus morhua 'NCC']
MSRGGPRRDEWRLHPDIIRLIWQKFGTAQGEAPDCSPQTEPTGRGRALSPHGGGRHSAHMEGAGTHAAFEYSLRTDSDLGSDATPVHIEGAATQFTLRTGQTAFLIPFLT